jgi:hypothetical protein
MKIIAYILGTCSFLFFATSVLANEASDQSFQEIESASYQSLDEAEAAAEKSLPDKNLLVPENNLDDFSDSADLTDTPQRIALEQGSQDVRPAPTPATPPGLQNEQLAPQAPAFAPVAPAAPPVSIPAQAPPVSTDPRFLIVPRPQPAGQINPLSTRIIINGIDTTHASDYEINTGIKLGNSRSTNVGVNATKLFTPYIQESASNQWIYRTEYTNNYVQARTVRQNRDISILLGTNSASRREDQSFAPSLGLGRVRQVIVSNGEQSALGRTVRGFNYSFNDRNAGLNSGIQVLTEALPSAEPQLTPGKPGKPFFINSNLMQAANNLRLPENSFTAYSVGQGYAANTSDLQSISPPANYNSLWVGLSPILDRSAVLPSNNAARLSELTDYYPHVSLTGNTTTVDSVFRYYTGAIFNMGFKPNRTRDNNNIKAYGGLDFSNVSTSGFSYDLAAIGYTNADPDNYSRLTANVGQRINLSENPAYNLSLAAGFNYAIDGDSVFDNLTFRPGNSFVNTGATLNLGDVSLGTTYFIPNGLPNPIGSLLSTSLSWRLNNIALSGYYTPVNDNVSRSPYGVNAAVRFGAEPNSPSMVLSWNRNETRFSGTQNANENVLGVFFRFGAPANPAQLGR